MRGGADSEKDAYKANLESLFALNEAHAGQLATLASFTVPAGAVDTLDVLRNTLTGLPTLVEAAVVQIEELAAALRTVSREWVITLRVDGADVRTLKAHVDSLAGSLGATVAPAAGTSAPRQGLFTRAREALFGPPRPAAPEASTGAVPPPAAPVPAPAAAGPGVGSAPAPVAAPAPPPAPPEMVPGTGSAPPPAPSPAPAPVYTGGPAIGSPATAGPSPVMPPVFMRGGGTTMVPPPEPAPYLGGPRLFRPAAYTGPLDLIGGGALPQLGGRGPLITRGTDLERTLPLPAWHRRSERYAMASFLPETPGESEPGAAWWEQQTSAGTKHGINHEIKAGGLSRAKRYIQNWLDMRNQFMDLSDEATAALQTGQIPEARRPIVQKILGHQFPTHEDEPVSTRHTPLRMRFFTSRGGLPQPIADLQNELIEAMPAEGQQIPPRLITRRMVGGAAREIGKSKTATRQLFEQGKLPFFRIPGSGDRKATTNIETAYQQALKAAGLDTPMDIGKHFQTMPTDVSLVRDHLKRAQAEIDKLEGLKARASLRESPEVLGHIQQQLDHFRLFVQSRADELARLGGVFEQEAATWKDTAAAEQRLASALPSVAATPLSQGTTTVPAGPLTAAGAATMNAEALAAPPADWERQRARLVDQLGDLHSHVQRYEHVQAHRRRGEDLVRAKRMEPEDLDALKQQESDLREVVRPLQEAKAELDARLAGLPLEPGTVAAPPITEPLIGQLQAEPALPKEAVHRPAGAAARLPTTLPSGAGPEVVTKGHYSGFTSKVKTTFGDLPKAVQRLLSAQGQHITVSPGTTLAAAVEEGDLPMPAGMTVEKLRASGKQGLTYMAGENAGRIHLMSQASKAVQTEEFMHALDLAMGQAQGLGLASEHPEVKAHLAASQAIPGQPLGESALESPREYFAQSMAQYADVKGGGRERLRTTDYSAYQMAERQLELANQLVGQAVPEVLEGAAPSVAAPAPRTAETPAEPVKPTGPPPAKPEAPPTDTPAKPEAPPVETPAEPVKLAEQPQPTVQVKPLTPQERAGMVTKLGQMHTLMVNKATTDLQRPNIGAHMQRLMEKHGITQQEVDAEVARAAETGVAGAGSGAAVEQRKAAGAEVARLQEQVTKRQDYIKKVDTALRTYLRADEDVRRTIDKGGVAYKKAFEANEAARQKFLNTIGEKHWDRLDLEALEESTEGKQPGAFRQPLTQRVNEIRAPINAGLERREAQLKVAQENYERALAAEQEEKRAAAEAAAEAEAAARAASKEAPGPTTEGVAYGTSAVERARTEVTSRPGLEVLRTAGVVQQHFAQTVAPTPLSPLVGLNMSTAVGEVATRARTLHALATHPGLAQVPGEMQVEAGTSIREVNALEDVLREVHEQLAEPNTVGVDTTVAREAVDALIARLREARTLLASIPGLAGAPAEATGGPAPTPPLPPTAAGPTPIGEAALQQIYNEHIKPLPAGGTLNKTTLTREVFGGDAARAKEALDILQKRGILTPGPQPRTLQVMPGYGQDAGDINVARASEALGVDAGQALPSGRTAHLPSAEATAAPPPAEEPPPAAAAPSIPRVPPPAPPPPAAEAPAPVVPPVVETEARFTVNPTDAATEETWAAKLKEIALREKIVTQAYLDLVGGDALGNARFWADTLNLLPKNIVTKVWLEIAPVAPPLVRGKGGHITVMPITGGPVLEHVTMTGDAIPKGGKVEETVHVTRTGDAIPVAGTVEEVAHVTRTGDPIPLPHTIPIEEPVHITRTGDPIPVPGKEVPVHETVTVTGGDHPREVKIKERVVSVVGGLKDQVNMYTGGLGMGLFMVNSMIADSLIGGVDWGKIWKTAFPKTKEPVLPKGIPLRTDLDQHLLNIYNATNHPAWTKDGIRIQGSADAPGGSRATIDAAQLRKTMSPAELLEAARATRHDMIVDAKKQGLGDISTLEAPIPTMAQLQKTPDHGKKYIQSLRDKGYVPTVGEDTIAKQRQAAYKSYLDLVDLAEINVPRNRLHSTIALGARQQLAAGEDPWTAFRKTHPGAMMPGKDPRGLFAQAPAAKPAGLLVSIGNWWSAVAAIAQGVWQGLNKMNWGFVGQMIAAQLIAAPVMTVIEMAMIKGITLGFRALRGGGSVALKDLAPEAQAAARTTQATLEAKAAAGTLTDAEEIQLTQMRAGNYSSMKPKRGAAAADTGSTSLEDISHDQGEGARNKAWDRVVKLRARQTAGETLSPEDQQILADAKANNFSFASKDKTVLASFKARVAARGGTSSVAVADTGTAADTKVGTTPVTISPVTATPARESRAVLAAKTRAHTAQTAYKQALTDLDASGAKRTTPEQVEAARTAAQKAYQEAGMDWKADGRDRLPKTKMLIKADPTKSVAYRQAQAVAARDIEGEIRLLPKAQQTIVRARVAQLRAKTKAGKALGPTEAAELKGLESGTIEPVTKTLGIAETPALRTAVAVATGAAPAYQGTAAYRALAPQEQGAVNAYVKHWTTPGAKGATSATQAELARLQGGDFSSFAGHARSGPSAFGTPTVTSPRGARAGAKVARILRVGGKVLRFLGPAGDALAIAQATDYYGSLLEQGEDRNQALVKAWLKAHPGWVMDANTGNVHRKGYKSNPLLDALNIFDPKNKKGFYQAAEEEETYLSQAHPVPPRPHPRPRPRPRLRPRPHPTPAAGADAYTGRTYAAPPKSVTIQTKDGPATLSDPKLLTAYWQASQATGTPMSMLISQGWNESRWQANAVQQGVPEGLRGYGIAQFTATTGAPLLNKILHVRKGETWQQAAMDPTRAIAAQGELMRLKRGKGTWNDAAIGYAGALTPAVQAEFGMAAGMTTQGQLPLPAGAGAGAGGGSGGGKPKVIGVPLTLKVGPITFDQSAMKAALTFVRTHFHGALRDSLSAAVHAAFGDVDWKKHAQASQPHATTATKNLSTFIGTHFQNPLALALGTAAASSFLGIPFDASQKKTQPRGKAAAQHLATAVGTKLQTAQLKALNDATSGSWLGIDWGQPTKDAATLATGPIQTASDKVGLNWDSALRTAFVDDVDWLTILGEVINRMGGILSTIWSKLGAFIKSIFHLGARPAAPAGLHYDRGGKLVPDTPHQPHPGRVATLHDPALLGRLAQSRIRSDERLHPHWTAAQIERDTLAFLHNADRSVRIVTQNVVTDSSGHQHTYTHNSPTNVHVDSVTVTTNSSDPHAIVAAFHSKMIQGVHSRHGGR